MEASSRLAAIVALADVWSAMPTGCDMLVSAFAASGICSRRASVCRPFPTHIFGPDGYSAAAAAVQAFEGPDTLHDAPDIQLQLLQWLLLQLQRTWVVSPCTATAFLQDLQAFSGHSGLLEAVKHSCCILRVSPRCPADTSTTATSAAPHSTHAAAGKQGVLIGYHGTDLANVHSILHQGLLAASGTRLQTTGAAFGQGIYLSTDFSTAFQYTKGRKAWQHSSLGQHLRCVLVCGVDQQAVAPQGDGSSLPTTYIVAPRPSDVQIKYLIVLSDDALLGHAPRRRNSSAAGSSWHSSGGTSPGVARGRISATNVCWMVTCAYLGFVLLYGAWKHK